MNIDNQLLLGIVFITAGVAMGLLAYAAFLNRQQAQEEEASQEPIEGEPADLEDSPLEEEIVSEEAQEEAVESAESAPTVKAPEPLTEPDPIVGAEAETVAATTPESEAIQPSAEPTIKPPTEPTSPAERPAVMVDRDSSTNRLMIKVDDRVYHSMEALRESTDWPRVTDLFSDLLAWMIKSNEGQQVEEEGKDEEPTHQPVSMVQEINTILGEKLIDRETGPQAVRLLEGAGGTIRVYIGVESYSIDEVPDEEVKALIRQAVAEWEDRQ